MPREFEPLGPKSDAVVGARGLLEAKQRRAEGRFLAEGPQAVEAAYAAGLVDALYTTELVEPRAAERVYFIDQRALQALSDTVTPQGPVAVCRIPEAELTDVLRTSGFFVICDHLSDPGNLGTIVRTAAAAGAAAVITTEGCADLWSGKVVRATAGTFALLPLISGGDTADVIAAFKSAEVPLFVTAGESSYRYEHAALGQPHAWVIGSEAHGVGDDFRNAASTIVRIPMQAGVESLNAGIAAALCLYASGRAQGNF